MISRIRVCRPVRVAGVSVLWLAAASLAGRLPAAEPIRAANTQGGDVIVSSAGSAPADAIQTTNTPAIRAESSGAPPSYPPPDPFLGVAIPGGASVGGGRVIVTNASGLTTVSTAGPGGAPVAAIEARASSAGYPASVATALRNFTGAGITFEVDVASLLNPDDTPAALDSWIPGTLVDASGNAILDAEGRKTTLGGFRIDATGVAAFERGDDDDYALLANGGAVYVALEYEVVGTNSANGVQRRDRAALVARVQRTDTGVLTDTWAAVFETFGSSESAGSSALPDLQSYARDLAEIASSGGDGNSATVDNRGEITTTGRRSFGILSVSTGNTGASGRSGNMFRSAGGGGPGSAGGRAEIIACGTVETFGDESPAIVAQSLGGKGGRGGDGGWFRWGGVGGIGGASGTAEVSGGGTITTHGANASGILAVSAGGDGGDGGEADLVTPGGSGGAGSRSGPPPVQGSPGEPAVNVHGDWTINTSGDSAYGIWAKSVGGDAGWGGSGGWIAGDGGAGGSAADGGRVVVESAGSITTEGARAHGIYAESVGGFGGQGAGQFSLFASSGGSGGSAGSGGAVSVTQLQTGSIRTEDSGAHGIFAQSVGGGGGSGGSGTAFWGEGGDAGFGGHGGAVTVINDGRIDAGIPLVPPDADGDGEPDEPVAPENGTWARGIFAQSVGGKGGDGGAGSGVVGLGGAGSAASNGGTVTVTNRGTIHSLGQGIYAQSVGGGGGSGGSAGGWSSIGGSAGGGGDGAGVTVENDGSVTTSEDASAGIFAQSVGGGGGDGGGSAGGTFTIGGSGGAGGAAGTVEVTQRGSIVTEGDDSAGLLAQAVGGGGGNGGSAYSGSALSGLAVGGKGSTGGQGGAVQVHLDSREIDGETVPSTVTTTGDRAVGILAQSVGGGGGNGGSAIQTTTGTFGASSTALGGAGDKGGNGETVSLDGDGDVMTTGDASVGILLQSVGGGGGNGGMTLSTAAQAGIAGGSVSVSLGGTGGAGGVGGRVETDVTTRIVTQGDVATGFIAQSVGGGGGNGGTAIAASLSASAAGGGSFSVGVGGKGGTAGTGGAVDVTLTAAVSTAGDQADAILVQSVGGSGGNGGMAVSGAASVGGLASGSVATSIGGTGGGGGDAGEVKSDVNAHGTWAPDGTLTDGIRTTGDGADGVIVQAIGGGGGNGGISISATGAAAGVASAAVSVGIGGSGAKGGHGGHVEAEFSGDILTTGQNATGVLVQSVGGGGGNGGGTIAAALSASGVAGAGVSVGLGGGGDVGGDGGSADDATSIDPDDRDEDTLQAAVQATIGGKIVTKGRNSSGVVVQSVGGGGGNGGYAVSAAGALAGAAGVGVAVGVGGEGEGGGQGKAVQATLTADVSTSEESSTAILVQSVGGGGGNGGYSVSGSAAGSGAASGGVSVALGGEAGTGSTGGSVFATSSGSLSTDGNNSAAFVAQSIGGGGGNGGFAVSGSAAGGGIGSGAITVGLGGTAGGGGAGGLVHAMTETGTISTDGDNSIGFLAQSVGGGGGNGGYSVTGSVSGGGTASGAITLGLGGEGGTGGGGGTVVAQSKSTITTTGAFSNAFVAQSIGGGGGTGGYNISVAASGAGTGSGAVSVGLGGGGGTGSDGGEVRAETHNLISTAGRGSIGVLAQSVGGGGGSGGFNVSAAASAGGTGSGAVSVGLGGDGAGGGDGGAVTLDVVNNVVTLADDATAVIAQSVGGGGGNGSFSVSGSASAAGTGSGAGGVNIGGSGDGGGDGALVDSEVTGSIETHGANAIGVLVQSVGGGGGSGGTSVAAAISGAKTGSGALVVGVGGSGGGGGDGGEVISIVKGTVSTGQPLAETVTADRSTPANANAVLVQSVGGGGGNGGTNVSAAVSVAKDGSGSVAVGVGGFGAGGGSGGKVTSTVTGVGAADVAHFSTRGDDSTAIVAQSIGGGGGNGGANVSLGVNLTGKNGAAVGVGVGGFGAGGGDASTVNLTVTGNVVTSGSGSHGLLAQSVGGGGGNGGTNVSGALNVVTQGKGLGGSASIGVGGFGGTGGIGEAVTATFQDGSIITVRPEGDPEAPAGSDAATGASAMVVQSIGGGGGNGGVNVSGALSYAAAKDGDGHALAVGVGGFGGAGSRSSLVTANVVNGGTLQSWGDDRPTVLVQSIGGGGGNGAVNVSGGLASDSPIVVGIGGMAGDGGVAGEVMAKISADAIVSTGDRSAGIFAQSLGGGGGNGGMNVSGAVTFDKDNDTPAITFGIGGFGGSGATSEKVTVEHAGGISTTGSWSHGILAQSLGGGGGNGGLNIAGSANRPDAEQSESKGSFSLVVGLGGHGGDGAEGRNAEVTSSGEIRTTGDYARGVFAQSVGGGGGTGAVNISGVVAKNQSAAVVGVGGFGGDGAGASLASVKRGTETEAGGLIRTTGAGAFGIEASSIGGGGGDAGANLVLMYAPVDDGGSDEGDSGGDDSDEGEGGGDTPKTRPHPKHTGVDDQVFKNYDSVLDELEARQKPKLEEPAKRPKQPTKKKPTTYSAQVAIGGAAGSAGDGAAAYVENRGDIETTGRDSHGILAQSMGGGGGNARLNVVQGTTGDNKDSYGLNLAVGGGTGEGGNGARVDVKNFGVITTEGEEAFGILAQSIGGGGGNAGTDIINSDGKGNALDIKIGREGGSGGVGGEVWVTSEGEVYTAGEHAHAIMAQSVGNGGGTSSSHSFSGRKAEDDKKDDSDAGEEGADDEDDDSDETLFQIEVGVKGGTGGAASRVNVSAGGVIETLGGRSHGIFAQSVGGGGGEAGGVGDEESVTSSFMLMMGGDGGAAGSGGQVDVTSSAELWTHGDASVGILAQSVGGGGGAGGEVTANAKAGQYGGHFLGIGGSGGNASDGGAVTVNHSGSIGTLGRESHGILAQSIAGGGGNAGSVTRSLESGSDGIDVNLTIGGAGGSGGVAGRVQATNTGVIETFGEEAIGILAQSVGGGGGNGSRMISKSTSGADAAGNQLNILVGGSGGGGGTGGVVDVWNGEAPSETETGSGDEEPAALIRTRGRGAHGIFAMSIGGGGGSGSTIVRSNGDREADESAPANGFAVGLGGDGAVGGTGSAVTVQNFGAIETLGDGAHGVIAQSVGGGGGNGGLVLAGDLVLGDSGAETVTSGAMLVGGAGGSGNSAGAVTVNNAGSIVTHSDGSYGVFAQSVGGGGGNGGFTAELSGDLRTNPALTPAPYQANFGLGGRGGTGGDSGRVVVNNTGSIRVEGDNAYGVFAQSVSGGGGTAGVSLQSPVWMATNLALNLALGFEGASGTPGEVEVHSDGTIVTTGANSRAVFRQAVNGGGGAMNVFMDVSSKASAYAPETDEGADAINAVARDARADVGGTVKLGVNEAVETIGGNLFGEHKGDLVSFGKAAAADFVQSVGGGGGASDLLFAINDEATFDLDVVLGGSGSTGSGGGAVDFGRTGTIFTAGARSLGATVQSVGGGGGFVNLDVETLAVTAEEAARTVLAQRAFAAEPTGVVMAAGPTAGAPRAAFALGASSGEVSDGGVVDLTYSGDLYTEGERAHGLLVQSIGAGGGSAMVSGLDALDVTLGGTAGATGHGGAITLANSGLIQATGAHAHGMVLQSIGGGGGAVFTDMAPAAVAMTTHSDNSGNGGRVTLEQTGDVAVTGEGSIGILAQSLGGGGGIVDRLFMGTAGGAGSGGDVALEINGSVVASGSGGVAILAQSLGRDGRGDITVMVDEGGDVWAGEGGVAIWLDGGASNSVTTHGLVATADGLAGMAIRGTTGDDTIHNHGTLLGELDLGSGTNRVVNHAGAAMIPGVDLRLGSTQSVLLNEGALAPGGTGLAQPVAMTGSFEQAAGGESLIELDFLSGEIDSIHATGRADVAGRVSLSLLNPHRIQAGTFSMPIFSGDEGAGATAATLVAPESVVMASALNNASGRAVTLDATVDFAPDDLSANLTVVGDYLNAVQNAGSSPHLADTIVRLLYESDLGNYRAALTGMSPEFYGEHQAALIADNQRFMGIMLDRLPWGGGSGTESYWTTWMQHERESGSRDRHGDYQATHRTTDRTTFGVQRTSETWTCNLGVSLDSANMRGYGRNWLGKADTQHVGASIRRVFGQTALSASVGYAWNKTEARRAIDVTTPYEARSRRYLEIAGGLVGVSREIAMPEIADGRLWLRPSLDLGIAQVSASTEHETGAGSQNLVLLEGEETHVWTTPGLEVGYRYTAGSGLTIEPFLDFGLQYYLSRPATEVRAGLEVAPEAVEGMRLPVSLGQGARHASVGVEVGGVAPWSVRLSYHRYESSHGQSDAGELRGTFSF